MHTDLQILECPFQEKKRSVELKEVNSVFICIARLAGILKENKNGEKGFKTNFPASVGRGGELSNFFDHDLKSIVDFLTLTHKIV